MKIKSAPRQSWYADGGFRWRSAVLCRSRDSLTSPNARLGDFSEKGRPSWEIRLWRTFIHFFLGPSAPKFIHFLCYVQRAQDMQICFPFLFFCFRFFTYFYELILLFPRFRCFRTRSYFPLRTLFPTRIPAYRFTVLSLLILPSSFCHRTYYCARYLSLVYQDPKAQFPHGLVLILTLPSCIGFRCIALTTRI